jgi:hypothetical protein
MVLLALSVESEVGIEDDRQQVAAQAQSGGQRGF